MSDLPRPALNLGGEAVPPAARRTTSPVTDTHESIGEILSRERERAGRTLLDISLDLKIAPHHLIAIESDAFESLPGRAYATGFVRSYAAYLGLDAEALVARLKAAMADPDVKLPAAVPAARAPRKIRLERLPAESRNGTDFQAALSSPPQRAASPLPASERSLPRVSPVDRAAEVSPPERSMGQWVMVALMITVVSYFGYSIIASPQRVAPPGVTPVPARLAAEAGMGAKKIRPQTVASAKPRAQISRDAVRNPAQNAAHLVATVDEPARLARDLALAPVRNNVPPPVATNQPPPVIAREPALNPVGEAVPPQPDAVTSEAVFHPPLPLGERYGEQNRNSRVTLRVHRSTRLAVLGTRHHVWIDRILRAGDTYRVPNRSDLSLSVPDAGAVEVILDDNTVGFAGSDGIAIRGFSLQPQSIIKRYHWLQAEDFSAARPAKPPLPR